MRRKLALVLAAVVWLAAGHAAADEEDSTAAVHSLVDRLPMHDQEIGARMGVQMGGSGVTPGGMHVGGVFLYRLSDRTWFDGQAGLTFGGDELGCMNEPGMGTFCDHGSTAGFGFDVGGGVRLVFDPIAGDVLPFVRGGLAFQIAQFAADDLTGFAIPLWAGAGGRLRITDTIALTGELDIAFGPGFYGRGLGTETVASATVQFGVEFGL